MDPRVAELLSIPRISEMKRAATAPRPEGCSGGIHGPWCQALTDEHDSLLEEIRRLRVCHGDALKTIEFERQARWAAERDRDLVLDGLAELREAIAALVGK